MLISIIIAARNEGVQLQKTVDAAMAAKTTLPYEIIVVDDGSADGSAAFLALPPYAAVRLLQTAGSGIANARNLGASAANGDILIFCDAHLRFQDYWLENLTQEILFGKADGTCPVIEPLSAEENLYKMWQTIQDSVDIYNDEMFKMCGKTLTGLAVSRWLPPGPGPQEVLILPGGCFAVRKSVFQSIGGYDKDLQTYGWDEEAVSFSLWSAGYTVKAIPSATVWHLFRPAMPYSAKTESYYYNLLCFASLHYNDRRLKRLYQELATIPCCVSLQTEFSTNPYLQNKRILYQKNRMRDDDWLVKKFHLPI